MSSKIKKYTSFWYVSNKYGKKTRPFFNDLDNVFACKGEVISSDPISHVKKIHIAGQCYYVKVYTAGGKRLRRYIGRSRIRADWENLIFFDSLDIPVPEIVACGQELCFGIFKRGALITKEVPGSTDLATLAAKNSKCLKNRAWMEEVGFLYSEYTRRLHDNRFIHVDLKWRNILVTKGEKPEVYFIDCPSGKKVIYPLFKHGKIKDLACLDKIARY
ncbi:MAG: heptose kinase, partial [Desulfobacula sp.]|nr:heptose kinase [Desulfobacula sp.]